MATDNTFYSDLAIPPSEYLAEVLEEKGSIRRSPPMGDLFLRQQIIGCKLSPLRGFAVEQVLGVPAHLPGLEAQYQLMKAREMNRPNSRKTFPC